MVLPLDWDGAELQGFSPDPPCQHPTPALRGVTQQLYLLPSASARLLLPGGDITGTSIL